MVDGSLLLTNAALCLDLSGVLAEYLVHPGACRTTTSQRFGAPPERCSARGTGEADLQTRKLRPLLGRSCHVEAVSCSECPEGIGIDQVLRGSS